MNEDIKTPKYIIQLAQELRLNMTPSEKLLWQELKNKKVNGCRFRKQHPVHRYILDFYCSKYKLAIEIDGDIHKERKDYDEYRDQFLQNIGIKTIRFSSKDIISDLDNVIESIKDILSKLSSQVPLRGI